MSLREFLQLIRNGRWWMISGLLLGLVGAVVLTYWSTPIYSTNVTLYLAAIEGGGEPGQAYQGSLLAAQKAPAYAQLLGNDRITNEVSADLGDPVAPGAVTAQAEAGSAVLTLQARDPSPERARQIANLAAEKAANLVAELERPRDPLLSTVLTLRVVAPAELPSSPTSPNPVANIALGVILGGLAALGFLLVRRNLDRSIRTGAALESLAGVPLLGTIPLDKRARTHPVLLHDQPSARLAESFRQLRTNLQASCADGGYRGRTLAVTSAVSGEGKTAVLCNLAIALGLEGHKVLIVDADLRHPRVADYLEVEPSPGLTTVLVGGCTLEDAIEPGGGGLVDVLPSGPIPRNPSELLGSERTTNLVAALAARYEVVLVDTPAALPVTDAALLASRCDGALLVVRHGRTTSAQITATVTALKAVSARLDGSVFSMAPASTPLFGERLDFSSAADPLSPSELVTLSPDVMQGASTVEPASAGGAGVSTERTEDAAARGSKDRSDTNQAARRPSPRPRAAQSF